MSGAETRTEAAARRGTRAGPGTAARIVIMTGAGIGTEARIVSVTGAGIGTEARAGIVIVTGAGAGIGTEAEVEAEAVARTRQGLVHEEPSTGALLQARQARGTESVPRSLLSVVGLHHQPLHLQLRLHQPAPVHLPPRLGLATSLVTSRSPARSLASVDLFFEQF